MKTVRRNGDVYQFYYSYRSNQEANKEWDRLIALGYKVTKLTGQGLRHNMVDLFIRDSRIPHGYNKGLAPRLSR